MANATLILLVFCPKLTKKMPRGEGLNLNKEITEYLARTLGICMINGGNAMCNSALTGYSKTLVSNSPLVLCPEVKTINYNKTVANTLTATGAYQHH